tara:strand:+ start:431 stop:736 length:306 start_codon:yes stop_codon:yes gene_type:complete
MTSPRHAPIRPDWISKTLAGGVLGLTLAVALSGLFAWLGPGGISAANKDQLNMWLVPVIWLVPLSTVYLFRSGLRAWLWLGAANLIAGGALTATRLCLAGS